jgi:hypothetical protein
MISIPSTIGVEYFKPQIEFFQFQHFQVYGDDAKNKAIIPIVKYNHPNEKPIVDVDWNLNLSYMMVDSVYDYIKRDELWYIPINVFTCAKQVIRLLPDDVVVEIIDADLVHLKPYPSVYDHIDYNTILADATYEKWHMFISDKDSKNRKIIQHHLTHNEEGYMNGGFNIICRVKTLKKIIDDVIGYSKIITEEQEGNEHSWWCAMYGLNVACHNHKIKMIHTDNCYYPNINKFQDKHYLAHYSCDPKFPKHGLYNLDESKFEDNLFYNQAKKWISQQQS